MSPRKCQIRLMFPAWFLYKNCNMSTDFWILKRNCDMTWHQRKTLDVQILFTRSFKDRLRHVSKCHNCGGFFCENVFIEYIELTHEKYTPGLWNPGQAISLTSGDATEAQPTCVHFSLYFCFGCDGLYCITDW